MAYATFQATKDEKCDEKGTSLTTVKRNEGKGDTSLVVVREDEMKETMKATNKINNIIVKKEKLNEDLEKIH